MDAGKSLAMLQDATSPTLSNDSAIQITRSASDRELLSASSVVDTVMAEQISHNVVGNQESTSGAMPLVGAHANISTSSTAGFGSSFSDNEHSTSVRISDYHSSQKGETTGQHLNSIDANRKPNLIENSELSNGLHKFPAQEVQTDGRNTPDFSGNVSVSSDTDRSGADVGEQSKDGIVNRHTRANSIKKPTTFSKVSVTKNFMAKTAAGVTAPASVQPSSRASPISAASTPTARPRLIAKTGSSLTTKPKAMAELTSGPDASKVWNKNQPPQPAPAKQFTDEELKQQYGIHMASRLQADDNSKESKWADIDDDEDDWAPETVTWMDGTKSTIAPAETGAIPHGATVDQKQSEQQKPTEPARPSVSQATRMEPTSTRTILKPGAGSQSKQISLGSSSPGVDSRKPIGTAKISANPPSKSPWAKLPSIDAVPIVSPPIQQNERPSLPPQDGRFFDQSIAKPAPPTREMAPDAFDRFSRDSEPGARELFNSASGRYEPAPEARRGTGKWSRQPSVLQRPSQSAISPSEAPQGFQTRSQVDTGSLDSRRRGSSISHGSAPLRRMSTARTSDTPNTSEIHQATVIGHDMRNGSHDQSDGRPRFAQQSPWDQQLPTAPSVLSDSQQEPQDDPVEVQQRIMKEKREEARKRRLEEEAREEAAKQERLKAKLAALEGAGKSKRERDAEALAKSAETIIVDESSSSVDLALDSKMQSPGTKEHLVVQAPEPVQSPPLTDHAKEAKSQLLDGLDLPIPIPPKSSEAAGKSLTSSDHSVTQPSRAGLSPKTTPRTIFSQQPSPSRQALPTYSSPAERKQQGFPRAAFNNNDATISWPTTAPNANVWGSSGIGNGTFGGNDAFAPLQSNSLPPPPGMSQASGSARISPQGFGQEPRSPNLPQQQAQPPPGITQRPDVWTNHPRAGGPSPSAGMGRQAHPPGPIGPPSRAQHQQSHMQSPHLRQDQASAWQNAADRLPNEFHEGVAAADQQRKDMAMQSRQKEQFSGVIEETFKKTTTTGRLGSRAYAKPVHTVHDAQGSRTVGVHSPIPPSTQTQPLAPLPGSSPIDNAKQPLVVMHTEAEVLDAGHGARPAPQPPIGPPSILPQRHGLPAGGINFRAGPLPIITPFKDFSPPPPETSSHPVNEGDNHPRVRLPFSRPVVKLPPPPAMQPSQAQQSNNVMMSPIRSWGPPGARPIAMDPRWQARFNGLFNRTPIHTETPPSPPKTPPKSHGLALAVSSFSKGAFEDDSGLSVVKTTVSLPAVKKNVTKEGFTIDGSNDITSRPILEEMFSEEQSFGSRPVTRIPRNVTYENLVYSTLPTYDMFSLKAKDCPHWPEVQAMPELPVKYLLPRNHQGYFVKLPSANMRNKLVRYDTKNIPSRPSGSNERKHSGKFAKTKAPGEKPSPSGSNTPTSAKAEPTHTGSSSAKTRNTTLDRTSSSGGGAFGGKKDARSIKSHRGAQKSRA